MAFNSPSALEEDSAARKYPLEIRPKLDQGSAQEVARVDLRGNYRSHPPPRFSSSPTSSFGRRTSPIKHGSEFIRGNVSEIRLREKKRDLLPGKRPLGEDLLKVHYSSFPPPFLKTASSWCIQHKS